MRRGSVYWVNLEPAKPPEFGKTRPAVVVSSTVQNEVLDSVVVVPLSTVPGEIWPLRVSMSPDGGKQSFAVLPGIRQAAKSRLIEFVSLVPADSMARLDQALNLYLSD